MKQKGNNFFVYREFFCKKIITSYDSDLKMFAKKAFTLIELLVVISIVSLLASVILSSLNYAREDAQFAKFLSEGRQLTNAIEQYAIDNGDYPGINGCWHFTRPSPGCSPTAPAASGGSRILFLDIGCGDPDDPLNNIENQLVPKYLSENFLDSSTCYYYLNGSAIQRSGGSYVEHDPGRDYVIISFDYSSDRVGSNNPCVSSGHDYSGSAIDTDYYCWAKPR